MVSKLALQHFSGEPVGLQAYYKNATDVLRLATALSNGDVSLAKNTKYKNFSRKERRTLLGLLNELPSKPLLEDMLRHRIKWVRLGERLHPREYTRRFPRAQDVFSKVRDGKAHPTFGTRVEDSLGKGDPLGALNLLRNRPGELARRLDHLLRLTDQPSLVIEQFAGVAEKVATPVLLQVHAHFSTRTEETDLRVFFPKGQLAKAQVVENKLPKISPEVCFLVVKACEKALVQRFSEREFLGKAYLDPTMRHYLVPFSQRSASKSLRQVVRGSRLPMNGGNIIRLFMWWHDIGSTRVDLDLSAVFYTGDWKHMGHVSYTHLREHSVGAYHSGDITSAPKGASEFVDIDVEKALRNHVRYIVPSIYSFTAQPFEQMKAFAGWMSREAPQSGEIFEPKTVEQRYDLTAESRVSVPAVFDIVDRKVIWADLSLKDHPKRLVNVEGNLKGIAATAQGICQSYKTTLHTLFGLHMAARAEIVTGREEADISFAVDGDVTPFDFEKIASDYL